MNNLFLRVSIWVYLGIFFAYLLGPLVIMAITAFNSNGFPSVSPWDCFSYAWFSELFQDERILNGIKNSVIVGIGTVIMSVTMGLAGALILTQVWPKLRATYYTIVIAPILVPGVVLGISTVVFWQRVNNWLGLGPDSIFADGLFLTIVGQSTFIASYCMLVLVARLQRYDLTLNEAALDLGATHTQAFRKILLPFMMPAIATSAVLAFLASFENYNTTTFTFGDYPTLTIELAQKVRYGISPAISALAFIIIVLTVFGALTNEALKRRKELQAASAGATVKKVDGGFRLPAFLSRNPAMAALIALVVAIGLSGVNAMSHNPAQCIADVKEERDALRALEAEANLRALAERRAAAAAARAAEAAANGETTEETAPATGGSSQSGGTGAFGNVFAPTNLDGSDEAEPEASEEAPASPFGSVFDPGNLSGEEPSGDN